MVGVVLFGVVAFHVLLSQGQFQLERLQAKADTQQTQYEKLRLQVAQLESPERITNEAQNRLGMVPADKVTPVTPSAADMAKGTDNNAVSAGPAAPPTTDDPGDWAKVKPHLSSPAQ
jgi:cell division protein FtsL